MMRLTESKLQAEEIAYMKSWKHEAKCIQLLQLLEHLWSTRVKEWDLEVK